MTREEHLDWAKERALEYCDRGELQRALDSLISDLNKHSGMYDPDWVDSAVEKWMEGDLATQEQMRELINGLE